MSRPVRSSFGVKYLSKGRPGRGFYAVKIEIGCYGGRHGKTEYLYEGNNFELAKALAIKVNSLMRSGGATKVLEFKDYDMEGWIFAWQLKCDTIKKRTPSVKNAEKRGTTS